MRRYIGTADESLCSQGIEELKNNLLEGIYKWRTASKIYSSPYRRCRETAEIIFGNLRLVQKSRRVFVSEKEIILAKKEFDMLMLFMQNPDRVFSKEELYERLWSDESSGDIATVAVHINRLREKLSASTNKIETVWGAGYRFSRL